MGGFNGGSGDVLRAEDSHVWADEWTAISAPAAPRTDDLQFYVDTNARLTSVTFWPERPHEEVFGVMAVTFEGEN